MFKRDTADTRRVIIVDVMHMFYKYAYGGKCRLTSTLMVDGVPKVVDTTLPALTIKQLHRWSNYGVNPMVVCFDGVGSTKSRKAYFAKANGVREGGEPIGYKGTRKSQDSKFYEGVNITMNLLLQGGVVCLKADGFEADDLIAAAVVKAKAQYPNLPIDIITGDQDLLPLVDDQVSVFIQSKKSTWAESKDIEKRHYYQITPENYQEYIEGLTAYKKLQIPYNTLLLAKLLRGDKSDEIPPYPKFTPTKYNKLITSLIEDGYDLSNLCRYEIPQGVICYRGTEEPIPTDMIDKVPREQKMIKYSEPPTLTKLCNVLSEYLDEDIVNHVRFIYNGINLNGVFADLPDMFKRRPCVITQDIKGYVASRLQKEVSVIQVNLPFN